MGQLFSYAIASSLVMMVIYPVYKVLLSRERYFRLNRIILWSLYALALLLPMVHFHHPAASSPATLDAEVLVAVENIAELPVEVSPTPASGMRILLWIWLSGMAATLLLTASAALRLFMLWKNSTKAYVAGTKVAIVPSSTRLAPFSFYNKIFMADGSSPDENTLILLHEQSHIAHRHWIDLLWAQIFCIFQWFNPAAWLMRREFQEVHEYEADSAVLGAGINARDYQILLIKKAVGKQFPALANSLNHSKLKKRITMMSKSKEKRLRYLRVAAILPAIAVAAAVTNLNAVAAVISDASETSLTVSTGKVNENSPQQQIPEANMNEVTVVAYSDTPEKNDVPLIIAHGKEVKTAKLKSADDLEKIPESLPEKLAPKSNLSKLENFPQFPGGEKELMKFMMYNIHYPEKAIKEGREGIVVVSFTVTDKGKCVNPEIIRSQGEDLDAEARRIISILPDFIPGTVDGKPVNVKYTIPVTFRLKEKPKNDKAVARNIVLNGVKQGTDFDINSIPVDKIDSITISKDNPEYPGGVMYIYSHE